MIRRRRVLKLMGSGILAPGALLVVGAYEILPLPGLRLISGPPPVFAFGAAWGSGFVIDRPARS